MAPVAGHRIRLRGPWKIERTTGSDQRFGSAEVQKHPEEWPDIFTKDGGQVRLSRVFHAPSNVDAKETVFVMLTGVYGEGTVCLNGHQIGRFTAEQTAWEFAIPAALPFQNELSITIAYPTPSAAQSKVGVYDVVALEIRSSETSEGRAANS